MSDHRLYLNGVMNRKRHSLLSKYRQVYDSEGQKVDMFTGQSTRPRILISDGASMVLRFYSNGASDNGFKADVNYINPNSASNSTDYLTRTGITSSAYLRQFIAIE